MKQIFIDNASTTKVDEEVIASMLPYFSKLYGNPSSLHNFGREALEGLNKSRNKVANLLHAKDNEIIFTAGGTESDNIAIKGVVYNHKDIRKLKGPHIITSTIEHPAVLETCKHLETQGFKIHYLPVDKFGLINIDDLQKSLSKNTILITIMYANNEIGTIEPVKEIGAIAKENNIPFHTDAVQAIGKVPIDVDKLNIDMLSISSHKIYGPKGTGALYIKEGVKLQSIVHGGGHESGLRSSTHNMPGIIGLGKACELAKKRMTKDIQYLKKLRDYLINNILQIEESYLNGHPEERLVNNAHFRFSGIEGEALLMRLDENGIATSTGSACSSRKLDTSHVLKAIGLGPVESQGSVRITIGRNNTEDEVTHVSKVLPKIVDELRVISPLWN
jgi:cysteine desulfurase